MQNDGNLVLYAYYSGSGVTLQKACWSANVYDSSGYNPQAYAAYDKSTNEPQVYWYDSNLGRYLIRWHSGSYGGNYVNISNTGRLYVGNTLISPACYYNEFGWV